MFVATPSKLLFGMAAKNEDVIVKALCRAREELHEKLMQIDRILCELGISVYLIGNFYTFPKRKRKFARFKL